MPEYSEILGSLIGVLPMIKRTHSCFVIES